MGFPLNLYRQFTLGYWLFYFLVFMIQMRTKTFIGKIFSQMSMYVAYLPSTIFWTVNLWPLLVGLYYTKLLLDQLRWGTWTCFFTLRVYWPMSLNLTYSQGSHYDQHSIGVIPYFGCVSCIGKIYKICFATGWYSVSLSSLSWVWSQCLFEMWVARVR